MRTGKNKRNSHEMLLWRCVTCHKEHKLQSDYCSHQCFVADKEDKKDGKK